MSASRQHTRSYPSTWCLPRLATAAGSVFAVVYTSSMRMTSVTLTCFHRTLGAAPLRPLSGHRVRLPPSCCAWGAVPWFHCCSAQRNGGVASRPLHALPSFFCGAMSGLPLLCHLRTLAHSSCSPLWHDDSGLPPVHRSGASCHRPGNILPLRVHRCDPMLRLVHLAIRAVRFRFLVAAVQDLCQQSSGKLIGTPHEFGTRIIDTKDL